MKARTVIVSFECETPFQTRTIEAAKKIDMYDKTMSFLGRLNLSERPRVNVIRGTKPKLSKKGARR